MKQKLFALFEKLNCGQNFTLLLLRLLLGIIFILSGWGKLHHLPDIVAYFEELKIPFPQLQAPFVASVEFFGGICILLGFAFRPVAALLTGVMAVALLTAIVPELEQKSQVLNSVELIYLMVFVYFITRGAGKFSLDHLLKGSA